jgi:hypothetical protein
MPKIDTWVGFLTVFSALAIVLGYVFELAFVSTFDARLLQFLTVEDYVSAASFYVFAVPVALFGTTVVVSDNIQLPHRVRGIVQYYFLDDRVFTAEQRKRARRTGTYIALIAAGLVAALLAIGFVDGKLIALPLPLRRVGEFVVPACLWLISVGIAVRFLANLVDPRERRVGGFTALVLVSGIAMYLYGSYEGNSIREIAQNNVRIVQKNGREIDAVLIGHFLEGVAVRYTGNSAVYFVPSENVAQITLVKLAP